MVLVTNARLTFNSIPDGHLKPGDLVHDTSNKIDPDTVPLNGGILLKLIVLSPDPFMRTLMNSDGEPPYDLGEPINGFAVAFVVRSEVSTIKPGTHIHTFLPYQNYVVFPNADLLASLPNEAGIPWTAYVGAAGMPGQTAYMGWKEYAKAKKGDVAFMSGAAGPVGSFVVQLAKRDGVKVIASAGSDSKLKFLKELGADVVFNYKTTSLSEVLKKEGPIDIFWDNVGGETLDAALYAANLGARFIECGMIGGYNTGNVGVKNLYHLVTKSISMHGFIVTTLWPKYLEDFYKEVPKLIADGEIKHSEVVYKGFQGVEKALEDMFNGVNAGKLVAVLGDD
ncbi:NAD(P)-binding protein [Coprinellus micaceus]|uniref:NAD(P)-binding protein n=1 Tax=Coprinellus micaceus TaxID=71717 RepID=A0A4Y7SSC4_COPMI|nr:NAD(P)-binding protein [Coprinellus micaceus]